MEEEELIELAEKHENASFYKNSDGTPRDPAFFMHQYFEKSPFASNGEKKYTQSDVEIVALLSSSLAFGQRPKILQAIQKILDAIENEKMTPSEWVKSGCFKKMFQENAAGYYYRTFSNKNLHDFFDAIKKILETGENLGSWLKSKIRAASCTNSSPDSAASLAKNSHPLVFVINSLIEAFDCSPLIPKNSESACKRVCLFLRWMVRKSEVDVGLWDFIGRENLIIPLDTHVMQSAKKLGIISETSANASMKNALKITRAMENIFKNDPCKGDFALFGAEVDN